MSRWLAACVFLTVVWAGLDAKAWFGNGKTVRGWSKYMATKAKVTPQARRFSFDLFHSSFQLTSKIRVTRCPANVYFLIDGSDSIPADMYTRELDYVVQEITSLVNDFPLSKVGVIVYSNGVIMEFPLKMRTSAELDSLYIEIRSFPQPRLGTHITEALVHARNVLKTYMNEGNIIIALSDGCINNQKGTTNAALSAVRMDMYIRAVSVYKPNVRLMAATMSSNIRSIDVPNDWKEILACPASVLQDVPASSKCDDFIFVVDGSDSLCNGQQDVVKGYLERTIKRYSSVDIAIGVTVFSENIASQIAPTTDKDQLVRQIDALNFPGGGTSTNRGIKVAVNQLQQANRGNGCTLVLITDGPPLDVTLAVSEADAARAAGCTVLVVGIGSEVQRSTLVQLAGDSSNVFTANTYVDLYQQDLSAKICDGTNQRDCPIPCYHGTLQKTPCLCHCEQGYTGDDCNTPTSTCPLVCMNGYLETSTCRCQCYSGWMGSICDQQAPLPSCPANYCNYHGTVTGSPPNCDCICSSGYTGARCDTQINVSCPANYCNYHGVVSGSPPYCQCTCTGGYTGNRCQIECTNVCYNGGQRQRVNDICTCDCPVGWIGDACQTRDCSKTPCQNGGSPIEVRTGQCGCSCRVGTSGTFCENTVCVDNGQCLNGGVVTRLSNNQCGCTCRPPFSGDTCADSNCGACLNGGVISTSTGVCSCNCINGYTGQRCEFCNRNCRSMQGISAEVNGVCMCVCRQGEKLVNNLCQRSVCIDNGQCLNGGVVTRLSNNQCGCTCRPPFSGDTCADSNCGACLNGGVISTSSGVCSCNCINGYTGQRCEFCNRNCRSMQGISAEVNGVCMCVCPQGEKLVNNLCQRSGIPCPLNCVNGQRSSSSNDCQCLCNPGWTGKLCDQKVCSPADCSYQGTARFDMNTNKCVCICNPNYYGDSCQNVVTAPPPCAVDYCNYHGLVTGSPPNCVCNCDGGYSGNRCQIAAPPSCPANYCNYHGTVTGSPPNCGCICSSGYTGARCDTPPQPSCPANYCNYHGTVTGSSPNCGCICSSGYTGARCDTQITVSCAANYCNYHGDVSGSPPYCQCTCTGGYTGNRCQIAPQPSCPANYCNYHGTVTGSSPNCGCICSSGYTGARCDTQITVSCAANYCNYHGDVSGSPPYCQCTCTGGYTGNRCQIAPQPSCPANYCNYHGTVTGSSPNCGCICSSGYTGARCDTQITVSCAANYCNYHGDVSGSPPYCQCTCTGGYTGNRCQIAPQPSCPANYCNYHGTVTGSSPNCGCICSSGYTGARCDTQITVSCAANYCNYHGDVSGSPPYCQCTCTGGYTGNRCQIAPQPSCPANYCNYHGTVTGSSPNCGCICSSGYTGARCDTQITVSCAANYCNYHGDVSGSPPYCQCTCTGGYTGNRCQIAPQPSCPANYCNYHGIVTGSSPNCGCICSSGYTGARCDTQINVSCPANYCNYPAVVSGFPPFCQCTCSAGYTGNRCQIALQPSCPANYCNYHGTITGSSPNCGCICSSGYTGARCETPTITCTRADCSNHGNPTANGNICVCACDSGYSGPKCDSRDTVLTECTGANNPCLNGQKSYRDSCTNKCVCQCMGGFGGPRCEIIVEPTVCDNCTRINGVGYVPVKGRCDMYVHCDISSYYVRECAPGTLWNQDHKTCDHPQLTTCDEDPCATLSSGAFYVHNRECQKYWVCSAGKTVKEGCCPAGQGFNSQTGKCEVDPNCIMTCDGQENQCRSTSPFCHLQEDPNDKKVYLEPAIIEGKAGFVRKECGPRTMFNISLCVCVHDPDEAVYDCSVPATNPDEEITFNTIQKAASYEGVGLTDSVTGVDDKAGEFTGSGRVIWWRFANSGFSHNNTVIRMRVQPGQFQASKEYAVLSNGDCNRTASLSITMTTNKIIFKIRAENSEVEKIQEISYSANSNEWIEIELRYIRQSARGYSYVGFVKGYGGRQNTNELVMDGPIGTRTCALQVGHGSDTVENFVGFVDWVRVWDRCAPAEL